MTSNYNYRLDTPENQQRKQDYYHDLDEQDDSDAATPVSDDMWRAGR